MFIISLYVFISVGNCATIVCIVFKIISLAGGGGRIPSFLCPTWRASQYAFRQGESPCDDSYCNRGDPGVRQGQVSYV